MDTERTPNTNSTQKTDIDFMKGITAFERPTGIKRFFLRWTDHGKKHAKAFPDEKTRDNFARALMAAKEEIGRQAMSFNAAEWTRWLRFKELVGAVDPLTVAREWLSYRKGNIKGTVPCEEAIKRYLLICNKLDDRRVFLQKKRALERWLDFSGDVALGDVTPDMIRKWVSVSEVKYSLGQWALKHLRKELNSFFNWAIKERLMEWNPCSAVSLPKITIENVSVMPIEDAKRLFQVNRDYPVIARMALEAFGGLRFSHAAKISRDEILFEQKGIILNPEKHKSRRRGYLEALPDNLWEWLKAAPPETWDLTYNQYMTQKREAFARAKIPMEKNVLRHSFASYYLALTSDAMKTAEKLQHTSPVMLYKHYKGVANHADALAWFSIVP